MDLLLDKDTAALKFAIQRSCEIKAEIVARDERESGERMLLNLGHTFGHAIENILGMGFGCMAKQYQPAWSRLVIFLPSLVG